MSFALVVVAFGVDAWLLGDQGSALQRWGAFGLLITLALPLALGALDRVAAIALVGVLSLHRFLDGDPELLTAWPAFESILLLHAFVPPSPYGSWSARGRPDPGGDWRLPDRLHDAAWLVVGLAHLLAGLAAVTSEVWMASATPWSWSVCGANLAFLPLALAPRLRPLALLLGLVALAGGPIDGDLVLSLGAHLCCFTPAWLPPREAPARALLFDGDCGLCHRSVRFFLAEDVSGDALLYAPLGGPYALSRLPEAAVQELPDSLVLLGDDDQVHLRSSAVIRCLDRLGGGWRIVSWALRLCPRRLRDGVYDLVAARRHRLFAPPGEACPLVSPALRARFPLEAPPPT